MKIMIGLILVFSFFSKVDAKTYYSEYSTYSEYSKEVVEESDVVDVEVERRYKWYYEMFLGDYYKMGEGPFGNAHVNLYSYKFTDFSNWSLDYPDYYFGRVIEIRTNCETGECVEEYRYKDKLYYHSKIVKKYVEGYFKERNGLMLDKEDYQDYYRYRTREKIEVPETIIITKEEKIEDFISSTSSYSVVGEINYSTNGTYEVLIKTNFIEIPIIVEVLKPEHINNYYENLLETKNIFLEEKENLLELLTEKLEEEKRNKIEDSKKYDELLFLKEKIIQEKEEQIMNIKEENRICKEEISSKELEFSNNVLDYEEEILQLKKDIEYKNNLLEKKEKPEVIAVSNDTYLEEYEDMLKKYELCKQVTISLENKVEEKQNINKKYFFLSFFIISLVLFITLFLLRIKSIKKIN